MTLGERNELSKHEEDHQDPREVQRPVDAQLSEAEEEEEGLSPPSSTYSPLFSGSSPSSSSSSSYFALYPGTPEEGSAAGSPSPPQSPLRACPSPSALAGPPWSQSEDSFSTSDEERWGTGVEGEVAPPVALEGFHVKAVDLVAFLLHKYRTKQSTSKAEMLEVITPEYQDDFPVIWGQASECMQLVFGLDLIEVDPIVHSYVLVTVLGLSYDGMLSGISANHGQLVTQIKLDTVADLHHGPKLRKAGSLDEELKTPAAFSLLDGMNPLTHGHVHNYGCHLNLSCRLIIFAWVSP